MICIFICVGSNTALIMTISSNGSVCTPCQCSVMMKKPKTVHRAAEVDDINVSFMYIKTGEMRV